MVFDFIFVIICLILAISGFFKGLIKSLGQLLGFFFGALGASQFYSWGTKFIKEHFSLNGALLSVISWIAIFLLIYILFLALASLTNAVIRKIKLSWLDKSLGALFGIIKGMAGFLIIVWLISVFPELKLDQKLKINSKTYPLLANIENKVISVFHLERELISMSKDIRKIFLLPEKPHSK